MWSKDLYCNSQYYNSHYGALESPPSGVLNGGDGTVGGSTTVGGSSTVDAGTVGASGPHGQRVFVDGDHIWGRRLSV